MTAKLLICARKPIGELCFERALATRDDEIMIAGVTSNVQPEGWWGSSSIAARALALGLPFHPSDKKDNAGLLTFMRQIRPSVLLSIQHPWILSTAVLDVVEGRAFNLHLAPLPAYKGWNGCSHAILNREPAYGVTLHWITEALDSGNVAYESRFPIAADETAKSLYAKSATAGLSLFEQLLRDLAAGCTPPRHPMIGEGRLYRRRDLDAFREIAHGFDAETIDLRARALYFPPYEPAFIRVASRKTYVVPQVENVR